MSAAGRSALKSAHCAVRVVNNRAVYKNLGAQSVEDVCRLERSIGRAVDLAGEDDAIIADAHFDDVCHTCFGTGLDLFFADGAGCVRNIDGVFTNTFAEPLEARA